jgi:co-chaperonin GroES (HSP10)
MKFNQMSLGHRVILKPKIEKVSKGGIVIARGEREQAVNTNQGEVFMIGNSCWDNMQVKPDFKVGDKVYYARYGAMTIKPEGSEDFLVMCNDEDLLVGYQDE